MFEVTPPKEGKIEILAACDGLLKIDREKLNAVNSLGEMMIATVHGNFPVRKGDKIAGTRVIPLVIEKAKMRMLCQIYHMLQYRYLRYFLTGMCVTALSRRDPKFIRALSRTSSDRF